MKVNLKKVGIEAEADVEKLIEKGMDNWEKDWQEKHNAKKEILELKHKHKMEEQRAKNNIKSIDEIELEKAQIRLEQEKLNSARDENKSKRTIKIVSIFMFFIYGLFCITGFKDSHILSAIISLAQIILVTISIFSTINLISLFKNDYKVCLILSILLVIPWLAFSV